MKLTIEKTTTKEVEINFPCYRKKETMGGWAVAVIQENEIIELWKSGTAFNYDNMSKNVSKYFGEGWEDATAQEFFASLQQAQSDLWMNTPEEYMPQESDYEVGHGDGTIEINLSHFDAELNGFPPPTYLSGVTAEISPSNNNL